MIDYRNNTVFLMCIVINIVKVKKTRLIFWPILYISCTVAEVLLLSGSI